MNTVQFMITWEIPIENRKKSLAAFSHMTPEQEAAMMGSEIKLVGRWHDLVQRKGVCILESDNAQAVSAYAMNWNTVMNLELGLVVEDEQARALGLAEDSAVS